LLDNTSYTKVMELLFYMNNPISSMPMGTLKDLMYVHFYIRYTPYTIYTL